MTDIRIRVSYDIPAPPVDPPPSVFKYVGFRGLHEIEGGRVIPIEKMPAVIPARETFAVEMTRAIQELSYALMLAFCPSLTRKQWHNLHTCDRAMNNQGNGYKDNKGTCGGNWADWINGEYTTSANPKYDKMRTFEGSFMRGEWIGDVIVVRAGVHYIDARKPLPSVADVIANNWYSVAVNSAPDANMGNISHFEQGKGYPIVYPFISNRDTVTFDKDYFGVWQSDTLPDPLKVYTI